MIGQNPQRYEGLGFGNLSRRMPDSDHDAFIISGTQTGHLEELMPEDYATVTGCNPMANKVSAFGQTKPSSEALSHAILYQTSPAILWVMHLHSPDIFNRYTELNLPYSDPSAEYGTPEMALEIKRLAAGHDCSKPGFIVMAGHQDGILAFGNDAEATGRLVLATLERAKELSC
ncbi:MAG: class II aldolase/adducin family protein [Gammaproteobacteria bacterium]|nr:class II aldolase/adducin family protein [Gammaproteobacteria bacterium]NIR94971.1 class II aldolase/adducin family protein [Gammaproteobacteria bacterium]